jgi:flagellar hook-length control protein FliK
MNPLPTLVADPRPPTEVPRAGRRRSDRSRSEDGGGDFAAAVAAAGMAHARSDRSAAPDRARAGSAERDRDDEERRPDAVGDEPAVGTGTAARTVRPEGDPTGSGSSADRTESAEGASTARPEGVTGPNGAPDPTAASGAAPMTGTATAPVVEGAATQPADAATTPLAATTATGEPVASEAAVAAVASEIPSEASGRPTDGSGPSAPDRAVLDGVEVAPLATGAVRTPPAAVVLHGGRGSDDDPSAHPQPGELGRPAAEATPTGDLSVDDTASGESPDDVPLEKDPGSGTGAPTVAVGATAGSGASALGGPARLAGVDGAAAAGVSGRVPDAEPAVPAWRQVAAALRTVRDADKSPQAVSLELAPASLGRVRIEATLRNGVLDVRLHAETDQAHHALRTGMAELRRDVEATGVKSGRLEVQAFDRTNGDHAGDALDGRRPDTPTSLADGEPGVGGEQGSGRWRPGEGGSPSGATGARPSLGAVADRTVDPDSSSNRLDLHL